VAGGAGINLCARGDENKNFLHGLITPNPSPTKSGLKTHAVAQTLWSFGWRLSEKFLSFSFGIEKGPALVRF
jgi:hypothetical protein